MLVLVTVKGERLNCIVPMFLIIILRILLYRVSQDLGLALVSLAQDVILAIYQDLGIQIDKQKKRIGLFNLSFFIYISILTISRISSGNSYRST